MIYRTKDITLLTFLLFLKAFIYIALEIAPFLYPIENSLNIWIAIEAGHSPDLFVVLISHFHKPNNIMQPLSH